MSKLKARTVREDYQHSLRYMQALLNLLGAWPYPKASPLSTFLSYFTIFLAYFLQLFVLVPSVMYVLMKEKDTRRQMKLFMPHLNGASQMLKHTILLFRLKMLRKTLDEIEEDWLNATEENRLVLRKETETANKILLTVVLILYVTGLSYRTVIPLSKGTITLPDNTTMRLLPCPSYYIFFNEQITPCYEIIFAMQVLGGFYSYTLVCTVLGVFSMLSLHACGLLKILMNKMNVLSNQEDTSEDAVQVKIAEIVELHAKIQRFLANVDQVTAYVCFIEMMNETLIGCFVGYCIIMDLEEANASIVIYILLEVFCIFTTYVTCYIGQLVIDRSDDVRRTAMSVKWYRFLMKKARYLVPVIMSSNRTLKLTAGKVVNISLATSADIIKASVGYLNILRKTI